MKAKTKFLKMYYKLPKEARSELVFEPYGKRPMTLNVCWAEIAHNTQLSKGILKKLGYNDKATADNSRKIGLG